MYKRVSTAWKNFKDYRQKTLDSKAYQKRMEQAAEVAPEEVQSFFKQLKPMNSGIPMIRIGSKFDGGYVLPDDLEGVVACFSPGVSNMMNFDLEIAQRGIKCFLADASVDKLALNHPLFDFEQCFLGGKIQDKFMTLSDWVNRKAPSQGDLLLQMDIEGAEYETLAAADDAVLERFRLIVIEVHGFQRVFKKRQLAQLQTLFSRLNEQFVIVHLHHNNFQPLLTISKLRFSRVFEITLLRKDRVKKLSANVTIPHALDAPNMPGFPNVPIPEFWK